MKVLSGSFAENTERTSRFQREARALAALNDPNKLAVFDVGEVEGRPYLVTELLRGQSLREQLGRGKISVEQAIEWGISACPRDDGIREG